MNNPVSAFTLLLVLYVAAYFAAMKPRWINIYGKSCCVKGDLYATAMPGPRWESSHFKTPDHWTIKFFAPLVWAETKFRGEDYWIYRIGDPEPDWMK